MDAAMLSFAYATGLLSMLAPCSFAMLPSYIAWYLNKEDGKESTPRAVLNGLLATLGGGTVMGTIGILAILGIRTLNQLVYFRVIIGFVLVIMGILMVSGRSVTISLPIAINKKKGPLAVYTFGALYSLASLGCVASIYIGLVLVMSAQSLAFAATAVLIYIMGMGTILVPLTLAVSMSKTAMLKKIEGLMPHIKKIGGIILLCMGLYLVIFGIWG
jgi:cytochrome c biogenesis protein CcdA